MFELFRTDGTWLGQVSIPPEVAHIYAIEGGRLLTLVRDDFGVPYARVYAADLEANESMRARRP
jgi:hypothetical protein